MQQSLLSPKMTSSVFDAIKDGDWEGLLALYATSAYDAVCSADYARRSVGLQHQDQEHSSPRWVFRDGENENFYFCMVVTSSMHLEVLSAHALRDVPLQRKKMKGCI